MELCSDEDTTDCCRTGSLNAAFTDDWSAGDFEEWSGGYLGRCEDKELGVRGGPRVRLSKASQECSLYWSVLWTVQAGEERLEVVELAVHAIEEECVTLMFGLFEVCYFHTSSYVPHPICRFPARQCGRRCSIVEASVSASRHHAPGTWSLVKVIGHFVTEGH